MNERRHRAVLFVLLAAGAGCDGLNWSVPVTDPGHPEGPARVSNWRIPNPLGIDRCDTVPPGAMPLPNGSFVREWQARQALAADADDFVIYLHEWSMGGVELGPYGRYHLHEIAKRLPDAPHPVVVQPCVDEGHNQARRQWIVQCLAMMGVPDADERVIIAFPAAEGLYGDEALRIYQRTYSGQAGGAGLGGALGGGGFRGGFRGGLGGGLSLY